MQNSTLELNTLKSANMQSKALLVYKYSQINVLSLNASFFCHKQIMTQFLILIKQFPMFSKLKWSSLFIVRETEINFAGKQYFWQNFDDTYKDDYKIEDKEIGNTWIM